ncbi:MAG: class B sortase [Oscillospiraceae bacterium]|nr:class B sortase [Oscillospiraceae bacterium]
MRTYDTAERVPGRGFLNFSNKLLDLVVAAALLIGGLYAAYALWDNLQIYTAANQVQLEMKKLKPVQTEEKGSDFSELQALNHDVCAWITLDGTNIDFPVLQGDTNLTYINHDVYGDFSLSGSIFLDSGNRRDFTDPYSLIYGHHMENSLMFGDLELYEDRTFFEENSTGTLLLPGETCRLEILACILTNSGDESVFNPRRWQEDSAKLLRSLGERALNVRRDALEAIASEENFRLVALSTCSSEFTDARTVVLARIIESQGGYRNA